MPTPPLPDGFSIADWHRWQAVEANNLIWELLEQDPFPAKDAVRAAYASAFHWDRVPTKTVENEGRSIYMIGKVWLRHGDAAQALGYAERLLAWCEQHQLTDFDLAYAHELHARCLAALGRDDQARQAWRRAIEIPIANDEDRAILQADFAITPWGADADLP